MKDGRRVVVISSIGLPPGLVAASVDLHGLVEQELEHQRVIHGKTCELSNDVPPGLGLVTREILLRRVLENLLSNAVRASGASGRVRVAASTAAGRLRLSVEDSGSGFPADELPRLFDFFKASPARVSSGGSGLGLGLPITRELAFELAGSEVSAPIWAENRPEGGARIIVELPLQPAPEPGRFEL
ncbi:MAG: ATP-binding protein [Candidatus Riflebacteria bacterium]|nr:ATP-binding protein [Candidatus Riflebacteria bacterium]